MKNKNEKLKFNHLKTQFSQAPLPKEQLDELITLAKKFNPKMANYLETNYNELI